MTAPAHRAWLVDLDGTLYTPLWVKLGMAAELGLLGAFHARALRQFRHEHEELREAFRADPALTLPGSPFDEQLRRAAEKLGMDTPRLRAVVGSWMIERPGKWLRLARRTALLQEIADFHAAGGRTALVSDYPASAKLRALGASELFDVVVANGEHDEIRHLKPRPEGFLLAARTLGIEPGACLVIGDRDDADGAAARAAGMDFRLIR